MDDGEVALGKQGEVEWSTLHLFNSEVSERGGEFGNFGVERTANDEVCDGRRKVVYGLVEPT